MGDEDRKEKPSSPDPIAETSLSRPPDPQLAPVPAMPGLPPQAGGVPGLAVQLNLAQPAAPQAAMPAEMVRAVVREQIAFAEKQLEFNDRQLSRAAEAEENNKKRAHELVLSRDTTDQIRWTRKFWRSSAGAAACVVGAAILLYAKEYRYAIELLGAAGLFGAGYKAGEGAKKKPEAEESD